MQGIKFNLDANSISKVKEDFNKLIQELEDNSNVDIKLDINKINEEIKELSSNLGKINNKIKINVISSADFDVLNNKLSDEEKIIKDFAKKSGLKYTQELSQSIKDGISGKENLGQVINQIENKAVDEANAKGIKQYIKEVKERYSDLFNYLKGQKLSLSSNDFSKDEFEYIKNNLKGIASIKYDDKGLINIEKTIQEMRPLLNKFGATFEQLNTNSFQDVTLKLADLIKEYKQLNSLKNINTLGSQEDLIRDNTLKQLDECLYKLTNLQQLKRDINNNSNVSLINENNIVNNNKLLENSENTLDKIKEKYSQLGQVNFTNKTFNPVTKELEGFTVKIEKADGIIQKLKYDLQTVNGNKGFVLTNLNEVDDTAKIREKQLQTEQKINRQIEQQNEKLNEQVIKSQDNLNAIQMQWQQKVKGLFAGDIVPKDKILQLENMIKTMNLGTSKSEMQVIKNYYNDLIKLEKQLVSEKNKEKNATKATMEAYAKEQDRIAKMGQFKAKLPTENIFKDNDALKSYIKSLYDADAKITQFASANKNAQQAQKTMTITTKNANNEVHREKIVIDEATQSIYKQGEAISNNSTRMVGFGTSIKNAMKHITSYVSTMMGFYAVIGQVKNGVAEIGSLNKAQTNIQMVTGMNREQVQGLTKDLSGLAGQLYTTNKEMMAGAEEFLRAGKSIESTKNLLKASTIGSAISGQSNKDTSEQLIAISNGFKMNAENAKEMMGIVDTLSTIDNNASTSFAELAKGMSRCSSSAQMAGVDLKTLSSYVGITSSVTRKSAESIGESYKSIFARFQDVKQGKKFDANNEELGNVEISLNKVGVAIRKDAKHFRAFSDVISDLKGKWRSLNDIQKADISKSLAGTRQRENFLVLMDNLDEVDKLQKAVQGSAGSAEKKFNEAYGQSTEAKINKLKLSVEQFWMSTINSSTINKAVGGITHLVNGLNQIIQAGLGTKLALVGIGFTIFNTKKHLIGFIKALATGKGTINGVKQSLSTFQIIMKLFTKSEITSTTATVAFKGALVSLKGAMLAILTNPATWIFVGLATAVGVATYAIHKHIKKQQDLKKKNEELSKSYKDLTTAMKNNDTVGMTTGRENLKKEQQKLQDLIKQQKQLQDNIKNNKVPTSVTGNVAPNYHYELQKTNEAIKKQTELLKKNGFHIDDNTGAIQELSQAQNQLKTNGFFEHVQNLAEEQVQHKKEIVSLWKEYETLSNVENKNESQKQRLISITNDLKRYMGDLTVETDNNGNVVIRNTELVGKEINALDTENVSVGDLIDIKIQHARQTEICQTNMTKCVYAEVGARIQAYQDEINALSGLKSLMYGQTYQLTGGDKLDSLTTSFGLKTGSETMDNQIKARQNEINQLKNKEKEWNDRVAKIKNSFKVPKQPSHPNYTPSGGGGGRRSSGGGGSRRRSSGGGSGRKSSGGSGSHKSETQYKYDGKQESVYDATIKTINNSLDKSDKLIDKISQKIANLQSLESKSNFKDILAQENEKLEAQKEKLDRLKSAQSQADKMKNEIKEKFYSNWSWMKGKNLDAMSEKDFTDLYNKYYGQTMNFGTGDGAKKREEAYKRGADLFKEYKKNYEDASSLALDSADKQLKLEQEINSTTKERIEIQTQMFNEEEDRYQKRVSYSEYLRDVFNKTDEDRMKYTKQILEVNEDYQDKLYDHVNTLMAQKESVEENTAEWNIINQQIGEYQQKLIDTSKNIQDQKQAIKDLQWETQIKKYTELFNNLQDKMGDTHDKLELLMANNSNDYASRVKLMDEELTHSIEYNAQLRIANNQLQSQLNKLEKGTDEWTRVHDQIEEYNESIDTSTKSILDQQKAIANLQWETQLKRYTDILDAKKNDIDDLQAKLDIVNTKDKNDIGTKLALMESILSANENYLEQSEALRDNLIQQRDELQEGTAEWEKVNVKVKEYDNNIRNTTKSIEQHNSEILKVKWDFKIKQYTELLNARKDVISEIQNELDILNTKSDKENEDNIKKLAYMDKILQVNNDLLKKNTKLRDELVEQRNNLKEGTADWEMINNKVKEYDNNINQTTKSIAQQNKAVEDLLKTRTRLLLESQKKNQEKKLDKDIFGMSEDEWSEYHQRKIDRLQREIDEANEFTNKYGKDEYTDDELNAKNLELDQAKKETYENIKNYKEVFDDIHNQRIKAIDDELKRLDDKNNKEKISEDREKRRLELEKLRLELENTRNQKNIQQLTKDKNGLYQFVYVADQKKIDDLEQQIKTKEEDNVKWEQDLQDKEYRKKLEKEKKFEDDMMKAKQNFHSKENNKLQEHYQDMDKLVDEYLKSLKEKYNNNYVDMLAMLETQIEKEKSVQTKAQEDSLKAKQEYYKQQIERLDKHYDDKVKKADRYYKDEDKKLRIHHDDEISEIDSHYKNLNSITEVHMDDLKSIYSNKWDEMLKILEDKVKQAERIQKKLMGQSNSSGGDYSYSQAENDFLDAKANGNEKGADSVRDKYNKRSRSHHSSSSSSNSSSSSHSRPSSSDVGKFLSAKASGDSKTADSIRKKYSSFDTGGYTGSWGKDGKLAILHEKELVLNKYQTKDILKASELLSRVNPLNNISIPKINMPSVSDLGVSNKQPQVVKHVYQVDKIECPNVTNDSGVNNLFDSLSSLGFQYDPEPSLS